MPALITDEMLQVYAVEAPWDRLGRALRERYEGVLDRIALYYPFRPDECDRWRALAEAVHTA